MLSSGTDRGLDDGLQGDLAVLQTLTHVGWLNTQQVQALCFAGYTMATVRTRLRYLEEAHWIEHVRWRVGQSGGGQFWNITRQGIGMAERYLPVRVPVLLPDLGRPSTALERAEWRIGVVTRNLIVRLILAARRMALLANLDLMLSPAAWPSELATPSHQPDVELVIQWHPPTVKSGTWLPWSDMPGEAGPATRYVIYVARCSEVSPLTLLMKACAARKEQSAHVPVVVLQEADRYGRIQEQLRTLDLGGISLSTWPALEAGLLEGGWHTSDGSAKQATL